MKIFSSFTLKYSLIESYTINVFSNKIDDYLYNQINAETNIAMLEQIKADLINENPIDVLSGDFNNKKM